MKAASRLPVLFFDHASGLGGAERLLLSLLPHMDASRWQPHLVSTGGPLAEAAGALGLPVHLVPMPKLRRSARFVVDWSAGIRAILSLVREVRPAIVVANTVRAALYVAPAARLAGLPWVWYRHDFWLGESRPTHLWLDGLGKRALCAAAARVIAVSQATARQHPCPQRITVVPNGIETGAMPQQGAGGAWRAAYDLPAGAPVAGMVGRLNPIKGQERFLRAMAQVAQAVPGSRFLLVGGEVFAGHAGFREHLENLADRLGLAGRVIFTGQLADVRPALDAMDVFVQPGDAEAFGLTNLEAMAAARPVVAFAHGALSEIVAPGVTGVLVPPGNETGLAQAVTALLLDPARRAALGAAGRRRVLQEFDVAVMARGVEAVLASVAERGR